MTDVYMIGSKQIFVEQMDPKMNHDILDLDEIIHVHVAQFFHLTNWKAEARGLNK